MNILEKLVGVIAPHRCIGCDIEENRLICESCLESLPKVPSRCYKCKAVTEDYAVCRNCRATTPLRHMVVFTHYQNLAKELVHRMKYERARQGASEIAVVLHDYLQLFPIDSLVTHVPTATSRVRTRGYDHAKLIAYSLNTSVPPITLLARLGQAHQVGAHRAERLRQLEHAFRPRHQSLIRGSHIILIDDVLTTGATLETAARVLKRAGAKQVDAIVFAQA